MEIYSCTKCDLWSTTQDTCCGETMDNFYVDTVVAILNTHREEKQGTTHDHEQYCKSCNNDVTQSETISRKYYDKDTGKPEIVNGHLDDKGEFVADDVVAMDELEPFKGTNVCYDCGNTEFVTNIK